MTTLKPAKGLLLVAEPSIIGDVSFNRSVVLLAEYNESGSVGFILNKPLQYKLRDFVPEINSKLPVFNGGPVEQDNLYFIHCIPEIIPDSIEISNGIYWGGDFSAIIDLLKDDKLNKNQIRFFLGYSGWESEQLEQELEVNSWVVVPNNYNNSIIGKTNINFWKEKMIEFGGDYILWSNAPENPSFN
ncbi:MAG TPA: YqgE/AlgH family protein [Aequorivita sp.]|jgi:putative transcriptional regulator|nr:transcriptional regulator [Aequorivita sp.]MBP41624.1 transcriptional regulator [Aequorivita sp.]HBC03596.1 transcriptional regulator [Aequorivita sp.]HNP66574.1 YqgE/AlgH family protein [Aequorivita sp.]|tara:strand:+ start:99534 stop:100094 length:561 start_codon:yes stop_codon:yes gene_type:complete